MMPFTFKSLKLIKVKLDFLNIFLATTSCILMRSFLVAIEKFKHEEGKYSDTPFYIVYNGPGLRGSNYTERIERFTYGLYYDHWHHIMTIVYDYD